MFERGKDLMRRTAANEAVLFSENAMKDILGLVDGENEDLLYNVKASMAKSPNTAGQ